MTKWVKRGQKQNRVYHTDKECRRLRSEPVEINEQGVEMLRLNECKVCAGTGDYTACDRGYHNALKAAAKDQ